MRKVWKRLGQLALVASLAMAVYAIFVPGVAVAGKGKGGTPPPPCGCAVVIVLPDGTVCQLQSCGSDCVYVCTPP